MLDITRKVPFKKLTLKLIIEQEIEEKSDSTIRQECK